MFTWYFALLSFVLIVNSLEIDLHHRKEFSEGERLYGELIEKVQSYGDCWKRAVSDLHSGCKRLTEEIQSRLALSFTSCFLAHAGSEPCPCDRDMPVSGCLKNSSERVFSTYTQFFTHTHSICHYLQHKEWQEEASKTVLALVENSQMVNRKLAESSKSQSQMMDLQKSALNEQKRFISTGRILKAELQHSRQTARDMYEEFKTVTDEQRFLLFQVFDRLSNLQKLVLGEFTGVYSVAYHVVGILFVYVSTSVPRTAEARVWLILVTLLSAASERILTTYTLQGKLNPADANEIISSRIWLCRKMMCSLCLIILLIKYYRYKDYNVINNQILQEIQQQNKELLSFMKGMSSQENFFKHQNFLTSSPILQEIVEKTKTGIKDEESSILYPKRALPSQQVFANKENIPLNSTPITYSTGNLKASKKESVHQKKRNYNKVNTYGILSHEENTLSELESSGSRRYNLRSRLNSPQLSPYSGH